MGGGRDLASSSGKLARDNVYRGAAAGGLVPVTSQGILGPGPGAPSIRGYPNLGLLRFNSKGLLIPPPRPQNNPPPSFHQPPLLPLPLPLPVPRPSFHSIPCYNNNNNNINILVSTTINAVVWEDKVVGGGEKVELGLSSSDITAPPPSSLPMPSLSLRRKELNVRSCSVSSDAVDDNDGDNGGTLTEA